MRLETIPANRKTEKNIKYKTKKENTCNNFLEEMSKKITQKRNNAHESYRTFSQNTDIVVYGVMESNMEMAQ